MFLRQRGEIKIIKIKLCKQMVNKYIYIHYNELEFT